MTSQLGHCCQSMRCTDTMQYTPMLYIVSLWINVGDDIITTSPFSYSVSFV